MRDIPSLQTLCLRAVGGKSCSAETTFAKGTDGELSTASRLLRSYHQRSTEPSAGGNDQVSSVNSIPIQRTPAIGEGSARRKQANDVDIFHPWIAVYTDPSKDEEDEIPSSEKSVLYAEYGSPALDVLQSLIDSLVELSCMDDARLGLHFFREWKANVLLGCGVDDPTAAAPRQPASKRRRTSTDGAISSSSTPSQSESTRGSLSLHNATLQDETIDAMVESKMTINLAVLDFTGVANLTDDMLVQVLGQSPQLQRLSVKNCRRLTPKTLDALSENCLQMQAIDIGGAYNLQPTPLVLEMVAALPHLVELHASGLLWTDTILQDLTSLRSWQALSLGYLLPRHVTAEGLKQALVSQASSLHSLAIPFCEHIVDAALMGVLGRNLPHLTALDVRGNSNLTSLTGWYDGRATIQPIAPPPQPFLILGRYSGLSKPSVDETKRIHPLEAMELTCVLDAGGVGMGVPRRQ